MKGGIHVLCGMYCIMYCSLRIGGTFTHRVFTEVLEFALDALLLGPVRQHFWVRNYNPHQTGLDRNHKGEGNIRK